jgi:alcohol dehydrogenase class IV
MKNSFEGDGMLPDYAFVYPPFTFSNPKYLTACTGFDAVGQCIEACWNVNATEESDKFALDGLKLMWDVLPKALEGMTEDDRCKMAEGAYLSGRAINITRTTAPHAFSYIFTSHYGYAHGHAVALSFPFFYDKNVNCPEERYNGKDYSSYVRKMDKLKSLCGFSDSKGMLDYISRIGLNKLDVAKVDWHFYFEHTNLGRLGNNPFKMDDKECEELKTFFIKSYQV